MDTPRTRQQEAARVLVIEHDRDLGMLFVAVLTAEGYQAEWRPSHPDVLAEVREHPPDLLVLGMPPVSGNKAYSLLDSLRTDDSVRGIPVVVLTTAEQVAERAPTSFNVKGTLLMPFDLDDFIGQTRHALSQPSFHRRLPPESRPGGLIGRAETILAARSRDTLFRWVQRLRTETPLGDRDDLRFSEVLDNVPILIEVLSAVFHYESPKQMFDQNPQAADRVCLHTTTRREQRVSLELMVLEYSLLREEIWRTFWRELPEELERDEVARLHMLVDGTLDLIIQHTIPSYLGSQGRAQAA